MYEYKYGDTTYRAFQAVKHAEDTLGRLLTETELRKVCSQIPADFGKVSRNLNIYFPNRKGMDHLTTNFPA